MKEKRGGLHIDKLPGLSEDEAKEVAEKWNTLTDAEKEFKALGFSEVSKPTEPPPDVTPEELLHSTPEKHAAIFSACVNWYKYARYMSVIAKTKEQLAKAKLQDIEFRTRDGLKSMNKGKPRGEKMTEQEITDASKSSAEYQIAEVEALKARTIRELIEQAASNYSASVRLISRELNLRIEDNYFDRAETRSSSGASESRWAKKYGR